MARTGKGVSEVFGSTLFPSCFIPGVDVGAAEGDIAYVGAGSARGREPVDVVVIPDRVAQAWGGGGAGAVPVAARGRRGLRG